MTSFLPDNIKLLVHMRQRMHQDNRLALCLGAGASTAFNIPSWKKLIERIAAHPSIQGVELLKVSESLTSQSQFLYQRFLRMHPEPRREGEDDVMRAKRIGMGWLRIVHECLYKEAKTSEKDLRAHPYLWDLMPLIKKSSMTINYNFDDTVERMLYLHNSDKPVATDDKGFEVVWQPAMQFRRNHGVVYHPNGFLPLETVDGFSEQIIFMEQEFADQLVDVSAGHYGSLLHHLAKHTVIFIGLSLGDATLKHLLRVSAKNNPGNFHYHIHWCEEQKPSADEQEAIRKANFSIYNLVTLFLTTTEVKSLANLLVTDKDDFNGQCDAEIDGVTTDYRYYLTGTVGSGKTTTLEQIRSLATYDEWVDRRNPLLIRPHAELDSEERASVDDWINQQFRKKNRRVSAASQLIALIDRSPLDPLYFVANKAAASERASQLLHHMVPLYGSVNSIAPGHLILLTCDPRVLRLRLANRDKTYQESQLIEQSRTIKETWEGQLITIIDTTNLSSAQVVTRVLETILFEPYNPINFQSLCISISKNQQ